MVLEGNGEKAYEHDSYNEYVEVRNGGYYVAATRIALDGVVHAFRRGRTTEAILDARRAGWPTRSDFSESLDTVCCLQAERHLMVFAQRNPR